MRETWVQFLGWENPLGKGTATQSSILAWRIPWIEEPGRLQSMGLQRVRHDWGTFTFTPFQIRSDQISHSVVSDSLRPHESQHARLPCPSPTPGVHWDSRPSSQWCHPAISSSVRGDQKKKKEMIEGHKSGRTLSKFGEILKPIFLLSEYTVNPQHTNEFHSESECVSPICP